MKSQATMTMVLLYVPTSSYQDLLQENIVLVARSIYIYIPGYIRETTGNDGDDEVAVEYGNDVLSGKQTLRRQDHFASRQEHTMYAPTDQPTSVPSLILVAWVPQFFPLTVERGQGLPSYFLCVACPLVFFSCFVSLNLIIRCHFWFLSPNSFLGELLLFFVSRKESSSLIRARGLVTFFFSRNRFTDSLVLSHEDPKDRAANERQAPTCQLHLSCWRGRCHAHHQPISARRLLVWEVDVRDGRVEGAVCSGTDPSRFPVPPMSRAPGRRHGE